MLIKSNIKWTCYVEIGFMVLSIYNNKVVYSSFSCCHVTTEGGSFRDTCLHILNFEVVFSGVQGCCRFMFWAWYLMVQQKMLFLDWLVMVHHRTVLLFATSAVDSEKETLRAALVVVCTRVSEH